MMPDGTGYDCNAAFAEMDAFLRGDLPVEAVGRMQQHLDACRGCHEMAAYEQAFRARLRQLQDGTSCPPALRSRIAALLAADNADG